jgi:hypothetical protein
MLPSPHIVLHLKGSSIRGAGILLDQGKADLEGCVWTINIFQLGLESGDTVLGHSLVSTSS